jgi:hypothetical protein
MLLHCMARHAQAYKTFKCIENIQQNGHPEVRHVRRSAAATADRRPLPIEGHKAALLRHSL